MTVNVILNNDLVYEIEDMYNKGSDINLNYYFKSVTSNFSISTSIYSGWSKTCDFYGSDLNNTLFNISSISNQKYSELGTLEVQKDSVVLKFLDIYIITIMNNSIQLYNIYEESNDIIDQINAKDVIQVTRSDNSTALIFILYNSHIAIYEYPSKILNDQIFINISQINHYNAISDYLVFSDSTSLKIYSYNFTLKKYIQVSSGDLKSGTIIDSIKSIKSNDKYGGILLYLNIDKTKIQILNLETISVYSFPFYIYEFSMDGLIDFVVTGSGCFVLTESRVYAYDTLLQSLRFSFVLNIDKGFPLKDVAAVPYNNTIVFFNVTETHLNYAVYLQLNKLGDIIGYNYHRDGGSIIALNNSNFVELIKINCPDLNKNCDTDTWFEVYILNQSNLNSNEYKAKINITCSNFVKTRDLSYNATFYLYGMTILLSNRTVVKNISYVSEDIFLVSEYVKGADLQFQLTINDKKVDDDDKFSPIQFVDSLNRTIEINTTHELNSLALIKNTSFIMASTKDQLILIYDFSDPTIHKISHIPYRYNSECPFIETISTDDSYALFVASCNTATNSSITKPTLFIVILNLKILEDHIEKVYYPNFNVGSLRVVTQNINKFALILVEDNQKINNRVQVFFGEWNNGEVNFVSSPIINFYTLHLTQFLCEGADGFYPSKDHFELYLVDSYYGLRVFSYSNDLFTQNFGYPIDQPVKSIGYCGKLLFVGCLDTSVLIFTKYNNNFRNSVVLYPYSNYTNAYTARSGHINCNDYYQPSFLGLPVKSNTTYVMRIINILIKSSSAILRDVFISNITSESSYYSNAKFYNESLFFVADIENKRILGFSVKNPYLYFPKFSHSDFQKVEKKWGNSPYSLSLVYSSGAFSLTPQRYLIDRGAIRLSSSSDSTNISSWKVGLIIGCVLAALILIGFIMYKYFLKRRKLKEDPAIEESEEYIADIYSSTMKFNIQGRSYY